MSWGSWFQLSNSQGERLNISLEYIHSYQVGWLCEYIEFISGKPGLETSRHIRWGCVIPSLDCHKEVGTQYGNRHSPTCPSSDHPVCASRRTDKLLTLPRASTQSLPPALFDVATQWPSAYSPAYPSGPALSPLQLDSTLVSLSCLCTMEAWLQQKGLPRIGLGLLSYRQTIYISISPSFEPFWILLWPPNLL